MPRRKWFRRGLAFGDVICGFAWSLISNTVCLARQAACGFFRGVLRLRRSHDDGDRTERQRPAPPRGRDDLYAESVEILIRLGETPAAARTRIGELLAREPDLDTLERVLFRAYPRPGG